MEAACAEVAARREVIGRKSRETAHEFTVLS